ncbi:hypothetical protein [Acanthamoeba castellanii mimivirus]|uniref:Uncharacterized protein L123 n=6 Tax=Mimivirus TaxID=315393 RepID=YL123_MIMIV|nr:hypothetical protein MIMI_gp0140 [Acanthamoeba polyphaga mimivirus]Q5UPJ8.1 RecName: Full=Uncharacterized protein L123 [Acanthamoeba polyphaga mimivirus]ALR83634.1 hypothetical protein [Niemeyer virus]AMZ02571.1 hypothetical protein [Mimivirus Bombay]BAV61208.1 hypothetical protein [Acanthamoeba castellanii mimivirus]AAV50398.1 unknown [Acanthamoeba polyphaga mimivirus]ADO17989.1 hypothetical protein [Acanthamoeba polyphaga mimivirus]
MTISNQSDSKPLQFHSTTMSNLCTSCGERPKWFDSARQQYSPWCSNTCKNLNQTHAVQGQPICAIEGCHRPAHFDGKTFSPGCGIRHRNEALALGITKPKN